MIDIYVPSRARPDAIVIRKLASASIPFTIVLDEPRDIERYEKHVSSTTQILFLEHSRGIGYARQKIKERYRGVPLMMVDDDTQFRLRDFENPSRLPSCKTPKQVARFISIIDDFCASNKFDIGSVAESICKWNIDARTIKNGSYCSVTIFNSPRCFEIDYDPHLYKRMEDADILLQAITKKFDFLICNEVLRHCPMNKRAEDIGGCSNVYRNYDLMDMTTRYLIEKWGSDIIKLSSTKKIGSYPDFTVKYREFRRRYGYNY